MIVRISTIFVPDFAIFSSPIFLQFIYVRYNSVLYCRFCFFIGAISALAYVPLDEVVEYYKALVDEELPHVLADIRHQLEEEEDEPAERFSEIQRSIEAFLDYVEATYIGKV
jgi:hypothetical protein